jgi:hypothetical protein
MNQELTAKTAHLGYVLTWAVFPSASGWSSVSCSQALSGSPKRDGSAGRTGKTETRTPPRI